MGHGPYRWWQRPGGRWWRFGPGGPLIPVGTVSHRPSRGLSVLWVVGRGGDGPWDTGPTGGGSGLGAAGEGSGREAGGSGRDGVSPSVPWAIRSLSCPFPELPGEVGMA